MTEARALEVIQETLSKQPELCSAQTNDVNLPPPKFPTLSGNVLQYQVNMVTGTEVAKASVLAAPTSATPGMMSATVRKTTQYVPFGITLTELTKIRVIDASEESACNPARDSYVVAAYSDEKSPNPIAGQFVAVTVRKSDLNALVAALMVLSPQAKLVAGADL